MTKKNFESPEHLWEIFEKYCEFVKANPIIKIEQRKGNINLPKGLTQEEYKMFSKSLIELPIQRPLSMDGFENYLDKDMGLYVSNYKGNYDVYQDVIKKIRRTIRQDQIDGGMAMIYSQPITARLNGLVEKTSTEINIEQPLFGPKQLPQGEQVKIEG